MEPINDVFKRARELRTSRRNKEAIKLLQSVLRPDENEWKVCKELGHIMIDIGDIKESVRYFERAANSNPESSELWNNLGYAKKEKGDLKGAIHATRKAKSLAKDANDVNAANYNLACYFALSGKKESALEHLENACIGDAAIKEWAKEDTDLDSLRLDPRFKTILNPSSRDY